MKRALVVGSGAGGATAARELQGRFDVTVLEAGREFRPLRTSLPALETMRRTGLTVDPRQISLFFPAMQVRVVPEMVLVNGRCLGGSTAISTGNAVRADGALRDLGFDLDAEFDEVYREIPVSTDHQKRWREHTRDLYAISQQMGLDPRPTPKMGAYARCAGCGRCVLGCPYGVKWDSRRFLEDAIAQGARVVTGSRVEGVAIERGRATGVWAKEGLRRRFYSADLVVLAAGGLSTPVILQNSGIPCEPRLTVDPVLCVAIEWPDADQVREMEMPFVIQREGFILSPYFDYVSYLFNRDWRYPARNLLGIMIKLADESVGTVSRRQLCKPLTARDRERLVEGVRLCAEMLELLKAKARPSSPSKMFLGTLNAGHPAGMLPLSERELATCHPDRLPPNLYVADGTLLPAAPGNPQILTIIALAKRVCRFA